MILLAGSASAQQATLPEKSDIVLYGLYPTSGNLTSQGQAGLMAFDLAVSDINAYLTSIGSDLRVTSSVEEMDSERESALDKLIKLHDAEASVVLTYLSSDQAETAQDFIKTHEMLLLATGPSSPSLEIPGDNLIRFNPDDTIEARVTDKVLDERGITRIVPVVRDDSWGGGLINAVSISLPVGVTMENTLWYDPGMTDYSVIVSQLDRKIGTLLDALNPDEIAVYAVTGNEIQLIMTEAAKSEYENLSQVSWFGCSGNALLQDLTGTSEPAKMAYACNFTAISFGSNINSQQNSVYQSLKKSNGGNDPDGLTVATYDSVWIAFKALLMNGRQETKSIRDAVLLMAEQHNGIGGEYLMDENDDRFTGVYNIWSLKRDGEGVYWDLLSYAGIWSDSNDPTNIHIIPNNQ